FKSDLQGAQATFDQLGKETRDAAKDATDAVVGLPNARMVTVRERCAVAQNGAPDCQGGGRCRLPRQGIPDRQKPRHPVGAQMPGASPAQGPRAERCGMSD